MLDVTAIHEEIGTAADGTVGFPNSAVVTVEDMARFPCDA
jgi:hypothetical protein